jgi:hypothetical protein
VIIDEILSIFRHFMMEVHFIVNWVTFEWRSQIILIIMIVIMMMELLRRPKSQIVLHCVSLSLGSEDCVVPGDTCTIWLSRWSFPIVSSISC